MWALLWPVLGALVCLKVLPTLYWQWHFYTQYAYIPHRRMLPLLGDVMPFLNALRLGPLALETALEFKADTVFVWSSLTQHQGRLANLVCLDPRDVKHMLSDNFDNYEKGPFFHAIFRPLLGNGIFNVDGKLWEDQRKSASHLFRTRRMRQFFIETFRVRFFCWLGPAAPPFFAGTFVPTRASDSLSLSPDVNNNR
jgi:hypothetical protein